jgi:hypothetical protein
MTFLFNSSKSIIKFPFRNKRHEKRTADSNKKLTESKLLLACLSDTIPGVLNKDQENFGGGGNGLLSVLTG